MENDYRSSIFQKVQETNNMEISGKVWNRLLSAIRSNSIGAVKSYESKHEAKVLAKKYRFFTPTIMHRQLSNKLKYGEMLMPNAESYYASLILADITGFTRLSSRISSELLKQHINQFFSILIGIVNKNGGDVIKFLGDAVLIAFPYEEEASIQHKSAMITMASLCAIQLIKECGEYKQGTGINRVSLSLHCAISCGTVYGMCLGVGERWEYLITGYPVTILGKGISVAKAGEIFISHEAYEYIQDDFESVVNSNGYLLLTDRRLPSPSHNIIKMHRNSNSLFSRHSNNGSAPNLQRLGNSESVPVKQYIYSTGKGRIPIHNNNNNNSITMARQASCQRIDPYDSIDDDNEDDYDSKDSKDSGTGSIYEGDLSDTDPRNDLIITRRLFDSHKEYTERYKRKDRQSTTTNNTNKVLRTNSEGQSLDIFATDVVSLSTKSAPSLYSDRNNSLLPNWNSSLNSTRKRSTNGVTDIKLSPMIDSTTLAVEEVKMFRKGFLLQEEDNVLEQRTTRDLVLSIPSLCIALRCFVHEAVRTAFEDTGATYLFELRNVTSIFIELFGLDSDLNNGRVAGPQLALEVCIRCLEQCGGSLRQFTVDDKGCILIAAFGLPGSTHEDNCRRAVEVTALIRQFLVEIGIDCRAGIAEGRVFCGLVGCESRCEYTMMGCSVNLAARLMGACEPGEIQVNETVYRQTADSFVYDTLPKLHAKGYDTPVAVYRPISRVYSSSLLRLNTDDSLAFVGRTKELTVLLNAMSNTDPSPTYSRVIFINGLAGIGKTRLLAEAVRIVERTRNRQLNAGIVTISATTGRIPFSAIRQLLEQIFEVNDCRKGLLLGKEDCFIKKAASNKIEFGINSMMGESSETNENICSVVDSITNWINENFTSTYLQEHLLPKLMEVDETVNNNRKSRSSTLEGYELSPKSNVNSMDPTQSRINDLSHSMPESQNNIVCDYLLLDLIPLLGDVMSFKSENNVTSSLTSEQIPILREALILRILCCSLESSLLDVIIVDNLQWCDVASLRILSRLAHCVPAGALLLSSRPVGQTTSRRYSKMSALTTLEDRPDCYLVNQLKSTSSSSLLIELQPFDRDDIRLLVDNVMKADSSFSSTFHSLHSPDRIVERIMDRSNGSPLQATLLVKDLKSTLISGKYTESNSLPTEAQNLIIAQFDQLTKSDQVLLKVASVVGIRFTAAEIFASIHVLNLDSKKNGFNISVALNNLAEQGTLITSKNNAFYFHDKLFRDSIYQLMTTAQRQDIHMSLGNYYEARASENDHTSLNTIVYHYIQSSDVRKQCQYLQVAIEIAKFDRNYYLVIRYLRELIAMSIGMELEELFGRHCHKRSGSRRRSNSISNKKVLSSISTPFMQTFQRFATYLTQPRLQRHGRINVVIDEVDTDGFLDDTNERRLSLKDFRGHVILPLDVISDNKGTFKEMTLSTVCICIWDLGITEFMLGNLITSSNILLMGMHIAGFHPSILKTSIIPFLSTLSIEEYIIMQEALNTIIFIHLLIGDTVFAKFVSTLSYHLKSSYQPKMGVTTITSRKDSSPGLLIELLHSLVMMANSKNPKECNKAQSKFESVLDYQDASSLGKGCPDAVTTLYQALYQCTNSKFSTAIKLLNHAAVLATSSGNQYHLAFVTMGKAWCNFLSGKIAIAKEALEKVVVFASTNSNKSMYIWALELNIMIKAFSQDVSGIEFDQELIRTLRGMGNGSVDESWSQGVNVTGLGITSAAVLSFSLLITKIFRGSDRVDVDIDSLFADPCTSCSKLSSRKQGTMFGGIILFCSIYTTIDCYEKHMNAIIAQSHTTTISDKNSLDKKSISLNKTSYRSISCLTSSTFFNTTTSTDEYHRIIKLGSETLAQHAMRFPALTSLSLAIKMRMLRLYGCKKSDLSELDKEVKHSYIFHRQHVFAEGILHLERAQLCKKLGIVTDFLKIDDSSQIANICLMKLGVENSKLDSFFEEFKSNSIKFACK